MKTTEFMKAASIVALLTAPAGVAQAQIAVGHMVDYSGPTSDVGQPFGQGVADALAYVNLNGGIDGQELNVDTVDYGYQVPRSVSTYRRWVDENVAAIQGWGTADTEALSGFVASDRIPYISGSYAAQITDPVGQNTKGSGAAPYNFFYGPSYSDALRAMLTWAAEDWKAKGREGAPKYVHMGGNHPYPNSPKEAGEAMAGELGFEVLPAVQFALTPGDYTAQCLTLKSSGANYAYLGNTAGSNISVLKACKNSDVQVQFLGNVWGMDENAAKAAGDAADGVVFPVRTGVVFGDDAEGMKIVREISKISNPNATAYRPVHYLAGICSAFYMKEAMEWADKNGGVTGPGVKQGFYAKEDWVPAGLEGVCLPSTWTQSDHRGMLTVNLYRSRVSGPTQAPLPELMANGTIRLEKVATITLPRKPEWLAW